MPDAHDRIPAAELDSVLNPHRGEEQARAREHNLDVLGQRGVLLFGDESDEELADLWSAWRHVHQRSRFLRARPPRVRPS